MSIPALEAPHSGIVSVDELINHMSNINLNAQQRIAAAHTLAGTQQDLENYLNRPLEPVQMREFAQSDGGGYFNTSVSPVLKVIRLDPVEIPYAHLPLNWIGSPYAAPVIERDALIGPNGKLLDHFMPTIGDPVVVPGGIFIGYDASWYAVEYVAGYNGFMDEGLKQAIKVVAARSMGTIHDDTLSLRSGNAERATEPDTRGQGWTMDEKMSWDRLRRRVVV